MYFKKNNRDSDCEITRSKDSGQCGNYHYYSRETLYYIYSAYRNRSSNKYTPFTHSISSDYLNM